MTTQLQERPRTLPRADVRYTVPPRPRAEPVGHDVPASSTVPLKLLWWTTFAVFAAWLAAACYALVYLVSR